MYLIRSSDCAKAIFVGILFSSSSTIAAEIIPSASIGLEHTNNATLVPEQEVDELIVITNVGVALDAGTGPYRFNADASLEHKNYTEDAFGDQNYFNLSATAGWEMIKNRLDWKMQDFFSQETIDNLDPATPDNTQDTNVFTFGPTIQFPISPRQTLSLTPEYRKFSYETQNIDNQQNSIYASWVYQAFRTLNFGLSGTVNEVDYDDITISDNTFSSISLILSGKLSRTDYNISLGTTHVERDNGDSQRGFAGSLTWLHNITGYSNIRLYINSDLTDSSSELLNASVNPENGEFTSAQISEVIRNSILRIAYTKTDVSLVSSVWAELREQDYELALLDEEVQTVGIDFNYPVTAVLATGFTARYDHTKLTDLNREDDWYKVGGSVTYRFSRTLSTVFDVNFQDRDSTLDTEDFDELSVFVNLVYKGSL